MLVLVAALLAAAVVVVVVGAAAAVVAGVVVPVVGQAAVDEMLRPELDIRVFSFLLRTLQLSTL